MVHEPELLDQLEAIGGRSFDAVVWRHMFNELHPARANTRGARWNPPGVAAIYASLERETALAEAEYAIASQPIRPRVSRHLYQVHVTLSNALDIADRTLVEGLGLSAKELASTNHESCQAVGGAAHWLGYDGLLVPTARVPAGSNVVLYADRLDVDAAFEVVGREEVR